MYVVAAIREYIRRRNDIRGIETQLFMLSEAVWTYFKNHSCSMDSGCSTPSWCRHLTVWCTHYTLCQQFSGCCHGHASRYCTEDSRVVRWFQLLQILQESAGGEVANMGQSLLDSYFRTT